LVPLEGKAVKKPGAQVQVERLIEVVLNHEFPHGPVPAVIQRLAEEARAFDCRNIRAVVIGGGTGLSTVVGGNSQLAEWPQLPKVGLKEILPHLDVVVCTTDDGRSTGELLKHLPMIGIGDVRKLCLSMVVPEDLEAAYAIDGPHGRTLVRLIHGLFNHRFPKGFTDFGPVADPLRVVAESLRRACPKPLKDLLRRLGRFFTPRGDGPTVQPGGHCLGNLLLTASIFQETGGCFGQPPSPPAIRAGIDRIARAIGAPPGRLHPATATPGQLSFRYTNGVEVRGQSKLSTARRGFPIERVHVEFHKFPAVNPGILRAVRKADLIIIAPGSLYTSSIPVLLIPGIAEAVRANRSALKILGANFWVEEGETDITTTDQKRGFRVSELCEAYDRNIRGGCSGLFHVVLSANLENIRGSILRNYALEGKRPIYLDRRAVEALGIKPVEATIFSVSDPSITGAIRHDPVKFALAVRTLLYLRQRVPAGRGGRAFPPSGNPLRRKGQQKKPLLCDYWKTVNRILASKRFHPQGLREILLELIWQNRDIQAGHLAFFTGARIVPASRWDRSIEWDNVLGYYDPQDRQIKIHSHLLGDAKRLRGNILIALGESLLGRYIAERRWVAPSGMDGWGSRCFQIQLLLPDSRESFLTPAQLHEYLVLARMVPHSTDRSVYRITLNNQDGFLPPGLLFGLMYAWYLDNSYEPVMENEMSILHLKEGTLIPHQVQEYRRKKALVDFFRKEVFGYAEAIR
jgi:uncharacterized cofD-like protein